MKSKVNSNEKQVEMRELTKIGDEWVIGEWDASETDSKSKKNIISFKCRYLRQQSRNLVQLSTRIVYMQPL